MKGCELCGKLARMLCEADQASLCWGCDEEVHGANFLVARHSRTLLCHVCQSPTPWTAAGAKLGPTVSVCDSCAGRWSCGAGEVENLGGNDENDDDGADERDEDEDFDDDDDYEDDEEGEHGENQVVPLSSSTLLPPPPVVSSSSSVGDDSSMLFSGSCDVASSSKRMREDDDIGSSSSMLNNITTSMAMASRASCDDEVSSLSSLKPFKQRKTNELIDH